MRHPTRSVALFGLLLTACGGGGGGDDAGGGGGGGPGPVGLFLDATASNLPTNHISRQCMDVAARDFDADGDLDLVLAIEFQTNVYLLNDGSGRFTDVSASRGFTIGAGQDHEDMAVADLDGDGDLDLVFAAEDTTVHERYLNDAGSFTGVQLGPTSLANAVVAFDADRDGDQDLLFGGNPRLLLLNDGAANFSVDGINRVPEPGSITQDIAVGDIDGDGDLDLVWAQEGQNIVMLNDGGGLYSVAGGRLPVVVDESRVVLLADVDRDGDLDLFVGNVNQELNTNIGTNFLYLNDGAGNFTAAPAGSLPANSFGTYGAQFVDIDADTDLDLVLANSDLPNGQNIVGYKAYRNDGTGRFADITTEAFTGLDVAEHGFAVASGDFDRDGDSDLYLCSRGTFVGAQRVGSDDKLLLRR